MPFSPPLIVAFHFSFSQINAARKSKQKISENGEHAQHEQHVDARSEEIPGGVPEILANTVREPVPAAAASESPRFQHELTSVQQLQRSARKACAGESRQGAARCQVRAQAEDHEQWRDTAVGWNDQWTKGVGCKSVELEEML